MYFEGFSWLIGESSSYFWLTVLCLEFILVLVSLSCKYCVLFCFTIIPFVNLSHFNFKNLCKSLKKVEKEKYDEFIEEIGF